MRNICKTILKKTWKDKVGEKMGMTGTEACVWHPSEWLYTQRK